MQSLHALLPFSLLALPDAFDSAHASEHCASHQFLSSYPAQYIAYFSCSRPSASYLLRTPFAACFGNFEKPEKCSRKLFAGSHGRVVGQSTSRRYILTFFLLRYFSWLARLIFLVGMRLIRLSYYVSLLERLRRNELPNMNVSSKYSLFTFIFIYQSQHHYMLKYSRYMPRLPLTPYHASATTSHSNAYARRMGPEALPLRLQLLARDMILGFSQYVSLSALLLLRYSHIVFTSSSDDYSLDIIILIIDSFISFVLSSLWAKFH